MHRRWTVALLLFGSGACALVYQTAWLREFRLVFGASTGATSAVLAIFMGGLGFGGLLLGPRADRSANPLRFYANLELMIAASAALTPLLVYLARQIYIVTGGSVVMGMTAATLVRLVLAAVVLAIPTLLMGGTLPAAARAVEREGDVSRRELALIYGMNTVGAVAGTLLSTFVLLELFGTRRTLWVAALLNVLIAIAARTISRRVPDIVDQRVETESETPLPDAKAPPASFVLVAAAVVGFAFLLMELVWYRMLAPLLGGSTFTFGLILAMALLGIGLGGAAYSWMERGRVTLAHLAVTCGLEALLIAIPLVLGDRIAILALLLRPLSAGGFEALVLGWAAVTSIVVLPPALVAGFQFPLLIALLGEGRRDVGRHVGLAYLWNTMGAIAGSLVGGFGILPLMSAPGAWRLSAAILIALGATALLLWMREARRTVLRYAAVVLVLAPLPLLFAPGPSAAWRHSGIGAGRAARFEPTRNGLMDWVHRYRRATRWQTDGVESSVALTANDGLSFIINGKNDGNARHDAGTQVMSGLLGALLHGSVKRVLVVGMGTGSTSGWLGDLPEVEEVHTVELERAVLHVAEECGPVNQNAMSNPRVRVTIADAREVLLTIPRQYDLIFSEPSNPYRAGVASLFTRDFYRAAAKRLGPNGAFVQWMQAYEVDGPTVQTVIGTLATVFPSVELWQTKSGDLLLIASSKPPIRDVAVLRRRVASEPYRSALFHAWRVSDLEGVLARFIAGQELARAAVESDQFVVNTDDVNVVEFGFARSVGSTTQFDLESLREWARANGAHQPPLAGGAVDWARVEDRRLTMMTNDGAVPLLPRNASPEIRRRHAAQVAYLQGDLPRVVEEWGRQPRPPSDPVEMFVVAEALADRGDAAALPLIDAVRRGQNCEADAILARLQMRQGNLSGAAESLEKAFLQYRRDPWPHPRVMDRALETAAMVVNNDLTGALAARLYEAMKEPFAVFTLEDERRIRLVDIAVRRPPERCNSSTIAALHALEPHVPWRREFLITRRDCYARAGDALLGRAQRDLNAFADNEPLRTMALRPRAASR
jgi:spermidine synthase